MLFPSLSLLALSGLSLTAPSKRSYYTVKDSLNVPPRWHRVGAPKPNQVLRLHIGLAKGNFPELERHLYEVSDPTHPRYGQHLSQEEVDALVRPTEETSSLVSEWLSELGILKESQSSNQAGDWISIHLTVAAAERLLGTKYSVYRHEDGTEFVRTPEWSLPEYLHEHISTVQPTNSWMRAKPRIPTPKQPIKVNTSAAPVIPFTQQDPSPMTPNALRTFYGTLDYTPKATDKQFIALNDFLGEVNNRSDTSIYLSKFRPDALDAADGFKQISIAGGTLQQTPCTKAQLAKDIGVEGNLDVQTMLAIAWPVPLTAYSTGDHKPDAFTRPTTSILEEPFLLWVQHMLSLPSDQLPTIISTSYGDLEQYFPASYAQTMCENFAQLGARGVSLLFSSGDHGVGRAKDCFTNDDKKTPTFLPQFPATCPYVTVVGGTYQFNPEVAAFDPDYNPPFTSGSGFSKYFPQPVYQAGVVKQYLDNNNFFPQYNKLYNPDGRAYPDIAAQSVNFGIVWYGDDEEVSGTSAACPTAAGILGLVNDALLDAGRAPLGFLNPWLYSGGFKAFNDIQSGSSAGCNTNGFPSQRGWDAVTGFGSPNFPKILQELGL